MAEDFEPLDITPDSYACELGAFESGSYNVSVLLPNGLAWANPIDAGLFSHDGHGKKYQVQYFPVVNELYPAKGSRAGGTTVTIRGQGFSMDPGDMLVLLDGVACEIMTATLEEITCVTGPESAWALQNSTVAAPPTCISGAGASQCATCLVNSTACATCNSGSFVSGDVCLVLPSLSVTVNASQVGHETRFRAEGY
jgi:hypothetical protein